MLTGSRSQPLTKRLRDYKRITRYRKPWKYYFEISSTKCHTLWHLMTHTLGSDVWQSSGDCHWLDGKLNWKPYEIFHSTKWLLTNHIVSMLEKVSSVLTMAQRLSLSLHLKSLLSKSCSWRLHGKVYGMTVTVRLDKIKDSYWGIDTCIARINNRNEISFPKSFPFD